MGRMLPPRRFMFFHLDNGLDATANQLLFGRLGGAIAYVQNPVPRRHLRHRDGSAILGYMDISPRQFDRPND